MKLINILKKINKKRFSEDITIYEMKKMLNNNKNIVLLDVRSKQEFEEGHLKRAINVPLYEIKSSIEKKIKNKDKIIVAYCSAGIRSKKAIIILRKLGYTNVFNIKNGIE